MKNQSGIPTRFQHRCYNALAMVQGLSLTILPIIAILIIFAILF